MSTEKQQQQDRAKAYRLRLETERDDPATSSRRRRFISDHLETLDRIPSHSGSDDEARRALSWCRENGDPHLSPGVSSAGSPEPVTASVTGWRRWAARMLGVTK